MKHLICTLTLVALFAAFASAQESEQPSPEEFDKRLRELALELASEDPAVREKAIEEFRSLITAKAGGAAAKFKREDSVVIEIGSPLGKEKILGNWSTNGTKGRYTLESLGKGKYKLLALSVDPDGTEAKYSDEGLMADLRKKYPFLKNFGGMLFIGPGRIEGAVLKAQFAREAGALGALIPPTAATPKFIKELGLVVRRPSKELEFHLKLPTETTWIIESVTRGTKGEQLGLKRYDLITAADGADLTELAPLKTASKTLEIVRRSKPMRIALESQSPQRK